MYTKEQVVEMIRNGLTSARFADWYNEGGDFDKWICSDEDAPETAEIDTDIAALFSL